MKNQKGFTLIELLLVLAIIGIISAIAVPALLGQRSRARDRSCNSNSAGILGDIIAQYDRCKEEGTDVSTVAGFQANIIGATAAASRVPAIWTSKNPWSTTGALDAYNRTLGTETAADGTATRGLATATNQGQVQLGYLPVAAGTPGVLCSAVYMQNTITDAAGVASHVFYKVSNLE